MSDKQVDLFLDQLADAPVKDERARRTSYTSTWLQHILMHFFKRLFVSSAKNYLPLQGWVLPGTLRGTYDQIPDQKT